MNTDAMDTDFELGTEEKDSIRLLSGQAKQVLSTA
jgi:hypothetical protein